MTYLWVRSNELIYGMATPLACIRYPKSASHKSLVTIYVLTFILLFCGYFFCFIDLHLVHTGILFTKVCVRERDRGGYIIIKKANGRDRNRYSDRE